MEFEPATEMPEPRTLVLAERGLYLGTYVGPKFDFGFQARCEQSAMAEMDAQTRTLTHTPSA